MRAALAIVTLAGTLVGGARKTTPAPVLTLAPVVVTARQPHPEIHAAIRALEDAKEHLRVAAHDFGGHRVDAVKAIDVALAQLHTCLDYDR